MVVSLLALSLGLIAPRQCSDLWLRASQDLPGVSDCEQGIRFSDMPQLKLSAPMSMPLSEAQITHVAEADALDPLQLPGLSLVPESERPPFAVLILGRAGGVVAGATAAAVLHEVGHAILTWGYGYKFIWPTAGGPTPLLPYWRAEDAHGRPLKPERLRYIAGGGFVLSMGLEEVLLNSAKFPKSDVFVGGFLFYTLLNNLTYVITDIVDVARGGSGIGDIRDISCSRCSDWSLPREVVYAVLLTHSALSAARILIDPSFLSWSFWSENY